MFQLIDADVRELPIVIDFVQWLKSRHTLAAHIPPVAVTITVVRTEWYDEGIGKLPFESAVMSVYTYGTAQFCNTAKFADFLQTLCPIPKVGVKNDVNHWYNLLNFAKAEAIDWRRAKAKGMPDSVGTGS